MHSYIHANGKLTKGKGPSLCQQNAETVCCNSYRLRLQQRITSASHICRTFEIPLSTKFLCNSFHNRTFSLLCPCPSFTGSKRAAVHLCAHRPCPYKDKGGGCEMVKNSQKGPCFFCRCSRWSRSIPVPVRKVIMSESHLCQ